MQVGYKLKAEISLTLFDFDKVLFYYVFYFFLWNVIYLFGNKSFAVFLCLLRSIVLKVFFQCHQSVWLTAVCNLTALNKAHKSVAGSALSVAGCAEARNMTQLHKPVYNLVESSSVGNVELSGVFLLSLFLGVTANTGS